MNDCVRSLEAPLDNLSLVLLLQDVFPAVYGCSYDKRLKQLVSEFLFKLEQLLPVPNLEQVPTAVGTKKQKWFTASGVC